MVKIDTATKLLLTPPTQRTIIHEFHEVIAVLPSYKLSMIHLSINIELKKDYTESYLHINSSSKLYAGLRSEYIEKKLWCIDNDNVITSIRFLLSYTLFKKVFFY